MSSRYISAQYRSTDLPSRIDELRLGESDPIVVLEARLVEGYRRIDEAIARGDDVTQWETFWIDLLHEYEVRCDGILAAA